MSHNNLTFLISADKSNNPKPSVDNINKENPPPLNTSTPTRKNIQVPIIKPRTLKSHLQRGSTSSNKNRLPLTDLQGPSRPDNSKVKNKDCVHENRHKFQSTNTEKAPNKALQGDIIAKRKRACSYSGLPSKILKGLPETVTIRLRNVAQWKLPPKDKNEVFINGSDKDFATHDDLKPNNSKDEKRYQFQPTTENYPKNGLKVDLITKTKRRSCSYSGLPSKVLKGPPDTVAKRIKDVTESNLSPTSVVDCDENEVFESRPEDFPGHVNLIDIKQKRRRKSSSFSGPVSEIKGVPPTVTLRDQDVATVTEVLTKGDKKVQSKLPGILPVVGRKSTLKRGRKTGVENWNWYDLYDVDYINDNFFYNLKCEDKFVLRFRPLKEKVDSIARMNVVNWMVYLQQVLELWECTIFRAVRMMDSVLAKSKNLNKESYDLLGIICVWIAGKFTDNSRIIKTPKLFALAGGKYSRTELLEMERHVLKAIKFQVSFPEPTLFLYIFMRQLGIDSDQYIRLASTFFLECNMLDMTSSAAPPSQLACCALRLVLNNQGRIKKEQELLDFVDEAFISAESVIEYSERMDLFYEETLKVSPGSYKNIVAKYRSEHNFEISEKKTFTFINQ